MIYKTQPMKQQRMAVHACYGKPEFALFMDPGLGKTKVIIDEAFNLKLDRVLVICPKSIKTVWVDEIITHCPGYTIWMSGKKGFQKTVQHGNGPTFYIINIDIIYKEKNNLLGLAEMVVVDESTTIKKCTSKRTQAAIDIGLMATYRRILTGTPIANTPLDMYGQMAFLSYNILNGWSYETFERHFAVMGGYKDRQVVGYRNLQEMVELVAPHCFRATKQEYLPELPPRTTQIREIELSKASWTAYKAIVEEVVIELGENPMTVDMAIKKVTKLRQLTGGWMLGDDGKPVMVGHEKLEELLSLLDECQGQKVLIWCQFVHEIEQLCRYIPGAKAYYGKTSEKEREAARKDFDTLILQNDTGSMGLTLNEATVSIFYSNPSYPLPKEQARDRNHRKGQGQPVSEYELIVTGSIDESIFNSIINRKSLADAMVNAVNDPSQFREVLLPKRRVSWKAEDKTSNIVLPAGSH